MNVKKRASRTTPEQYELFLKELENSEELRSKKITTHSRTVDATWKRLVAKLKTCGPQRTIDAWKQIFANWVRRQSRVLRMRTAGLRSEEKLSSSQLRLMKIMDSAAVRGSRTKKDSGQQHASVIIENNDNIELVNEDGVIISSDADKLEFFCDGSVPAKNNISNKQGAQRITLNKFKCETCSSRSDMVMKAYDQNKQARSLLNEELLIELKGIRKSLEKQQEELQLQNEINKVRAQIEYEKAKAKYENFPL